MRNKSSNGTETSDAAAGRLAQLVTSMSFPKNMRWGSYDLRFVRPIRWLVALYGDDVVPLEIAGVHSGNVTRGHRFLGGETTSPSRRITWRSLREQHVIADVEEREAADRRQIERWPPRRAGKSRSRTICWRKCCSSSSTRPCCSARSIRAFLQHSAGSADHLDARASAVFPGAGRSRQAAAVFRHGAQRRPHVASSV